MGELSANVRRGLKRSLPFVGAILALAIAYLLYSGSEGIVAFGLMSFGAIVALALWANNATGVPLMPMIVVQQLVVNGLPIVNSHKVLSQYPPEFITRAGLEVMIYLCSLAAFWRMGMQVFAPSSPQAYALVGINREGVAGLSRLGFGLAGAATGYLILQSLDLTSVILQLLPNGSFPIVNALVGAASACGFFLLSMIVGSGELSALPRTLFWLLMACNCLISATTLLLSGTAAVVLSVVIGLFWSTGRIPWRFLLLVALALSFLNTGKTVMRGRYWERADDEAPRARGLTDLPAFYAEWTQAGIDSFNTGTDEKNPGSRRGHGEVKGQSLFDRLNNLQNILFVIDAIEEGHISPVNGRTYTLIPPLLVPRILWPSKPRTHEGQVLLNVHFGRQDMESTIKTYVAWGLLAEAYGNFGAIKGAIFLGLCLGLAFAWAENITTRKPLLSTEGFVAFAVFLGMANSYETVASVLITMIFQSVVPIVVACVPFVRRKTVVRPAPS
jgi:hypothetical protein